MAVSGGGVCLGGSAKRGCLPRGVYTGEVSAWGSVCQEGVCQEEGCLPRGCLPDTPPVNRITDRCKNVTVKRKHSSRMHTTHLVTVHALSLGVSAGVGVGIPGLGDGYTMDLGYPPPGHTHP